MFPTNEFKSFFKVTKSIRQQFNERRKFSVKENDLHSFIFRFDRHVSDDRAIEIEQGSFRWSTNENDALILKKFLIKKTFFFFVSFETFEILVSI